MIKKSLRIVKLIKIGCHFIMFILKYKNSGLNGQRITSDSVKQSTTVPSLKKKIRT